MRELTEEIKSVPKCCCDVSVSGFEDVGYDFSIVYCQCGGLISAVPVDDAEPFDITKYGFSCDSFYSITLIGGVIELEGEYCVDYTINKYDAIAIAKHFGLTEEDLK